MRLHMDSVLAIWAHVVAHIRAYLIRAILARGDRVDLDIRFIKGGVKKVLI